MAAHAGTGERPPFPVDPRAQAVLDRLWAEGHAAFLVGGAVRDALQGKQSTDWDVATEALPETVLRCFPGGRYENRFGTVVTDDVQITTFRRDHTYGDHRRPDQVSFTTDLDEDLARRDFTVNAIAWGRPVGADSALTGFRDPTGGQADLAARVLRAVGDPDARFEEDALRLLRAARIAGAGGLTVEPATLAAMTRHAPDVRWVATERIGDEVRRMLRAQQPSVSFRLLEATGILPVVLPELAAQCGMPQAKVTGHDLWGHTLATLDAGVLGTSDERLRLAALLHDIGKPSTYADGHYIGHAGAGAELARALLERLHHPARESAVIVRLVAEHMFQYEEAWTDAAVRRFVRRVGPDLIADLLRLRQADNIGSGLVADAGALDVLRERIDRELSSGVPMRLADLAVDGDDLLRELGRAPGPWLGELLERLLESVVNDPSRNTPACLLADARAWTVPDS
jgi:tRNA nucleotidyltransferase (CCA-adding enzyme)